jgi:hypothetical protein
MSKQRVQSVSGTKTPNQIPMSAIMVKPNFMGAPLGFRDDNHDWYPEEDACRLIPAALAVDVLHALPTPS